MKFGTNIDLRGNQLINFIVEKITGTLPTASSFEGRQVYSEDTNKLYYSDGSAWIELGNIPDKLMSYEGTWDASGGTAPIVSPTSADKGATYRISVAGTIDTIEYSAGDYIVYNGTSWEKLDCTDLVLSVNNKTGAVVLVTDDVAEAAENPTNLYFTVARVQALFADTNSIDVTTSGSGVQLDVKVDSTMMEITAAGVRVKDNTYTYNPKYTAQLTGDGTTTSFNVDHALETKDVDVTLYEDADGSEFIAGVARTTTSRVVVTITPALAVGEKINVIVGKK